MCVSRIVRDAPDLRDLATRKRKNPCARRSHGRSREIPLRTRAEPRDRSRRCDLAFVGFNCYARARSSFEWPNSPRELSLAPSDSSLRHLVQSPLSGAVCVFFLFFFFFPFSFFPRAFDTRDALTVRSPPPSVFFSSPSRERPASRSLVLSSRERERTALRAERSRFNSLLYLAAHRHTPRQSLCISVRFLERDRNDHAARVISRDDYAYRREGERGRERERESSLAISLSLSRRVRDAEPLDQK